MGLVHGRCAGLDVSKRDAKVCVRVAGGGRGGRTSSTVTTWGSTTNQVLALRDHLIDQRVSLVVMEATGAYWKPYYVLEDGPFEVTLVNAHQVKNLPGRKPDINPNLGKADYRVTILRRAGEGWSVLKRRQTHGQKDRLRINLPRGKYRVRLNPQYGVSTSNSTTVRLTR